MAKIDKVILLLATGAVLPAMHVNALTVSPSVGVGMQYTDNATQAATNEEDDWIPSAVLSVAVQDDEGPLQMDITGSFFHEHYLNDSYNDQNDLNLGAVVSWEQVRNRLIWDVSNLYTQTSVDSLGTRTPDNSQNTNVFSIGPNITLPISSRNRLTINPIFQDFYYSETDEDNQRYGVSTAWFYRLYPNMEIGLDGSTTKVDYDDEVTNPDYTISSLQAFVAGRGARSTYRISLGSTNIDRDVFEDSDGASGAASLLYELTDRASIDFRVSSDLTDSSDTFFESSTDPNSGSSSNQQVSGDVLRNNTIRVTLQRDDPVLSSRAWLEYQENDYEQQSVFDRESQTVGIDFGYPVNPRLTTRAYAEFNRVEEDINRTDKDYIIGGNASYQFSRSLSAEFDLRYEERDSTIATEEYDEIRAVVGLVYGFGRTGEIPRTGRQARY